MNGSTPFLNSRTCTPFFDASMAHQITTASRAISDGWKLTRADVDPPAGAVERRRDRRG